MDKLINVETMDREVALLLYKERMYIDGNHQFAFKRVLEDEGKELGLDIETEIDEIAKITHNLSEENKICTLDLYIDELNNKYLISHLKENLISNLQLLKEYAKDNNYTLGYFRDFSEDICTLLD